MLYNIDPRKLYITRLVIIMLQNFNIFKKTLHMSAP